MGDFGCTHTRRLSTLPAGIPHLNSVAACLILPVTHTFSQADDTYCTWRPVFSLHSPPLWTLPLCWGTVCIGGAFHPQFISGTHRRPLSWNTGDMPHTVILELLLRGCILFYTIPPLHSEDTLLWNAGAHSERLGVHCPCLTDSPLSITHPTGIRWAGMGLSLPLATLPPSFHTHLLRMSLFATSDVALPPLM